MENESKPEVPTENVNNETTSVEKSESASVAPPSESTTEPSLDDAVSASLTDLKVENDLTQKAPRVKDLLSSEDSPSRFATVLSLIFGTLALTCIALLVFVIVQRQRNKPHPEAALDTAPVLAEKMIQESLGHFQVVLKAEEGQTHDNDLRVDIVAECSNYAACDSIKGKLVEARDLIHPILSSATREELLSQDGKNRIRLRIAEQLNGIAHEGKVEQIHFTNMTIETGR